MKNAQHDRERGSDGCHLRTFRRALVVVLATLASACSSGGGSEIKSDGSAGVGGMQTGSGGATGIGGVVGTGSGGAAAGVGGAAGGGAAGAGGGSGCPARSSYTESEHTVLNVTWPAGLATMGGSGQVHIWSKVVFTANGNTLSGTLQACGSVLPPTGLSVLGGGGMVLIEIPDASWDAPSMPKFQFQATQSGWNVGSTISYGYTALIGLTLSDPAAAWPASYTGITTTVDAEADGKPGLTAIPRTGGGFVAPPTSIAQSARVDRVFIVSRNTVSATETRSTCDQASGTVSFMHFDNHVVGCHVMGGQDCAAAETNFVDQNRTIYQVTTASVQAKVVPDTATCADVRAALPM